MYIYIYIYIYIYVYVCICIYVFIPSSKAGLPQRKPGAHAHAITVDREVIAPAGL